MYNVSKVPVLHTSGGEGWREEGRGGEGWREEGEKGEISQTLNPNKSHREYSPLGDLTMVEMILSLSAGKLNVHICCVASVSVPRELVMILQPVMV